MPPDLIEATCVACLSCETVGERLGRVVSVPHPGGRVPHGDTGCIQQARVGVADRVPSRALLMEVAECMHEGFTSPSVVPPYRDGESVEDLKSAFRERYDAMTRARLGSVDRPVPSSGPPDVDDMAVYVAWLEGDGLTPAQAGEKDELGHAAPDAGHACDHLIDLVKGEVVASRRYGWSTWSTWGEW